MIVLRHLQQLKLKGNIQYIN